MKNELAEVLEALYNSEINASLSSFWDGGWSVYLGDDMNGYKADEVFYDLAPVADWLTEEAIEHYPDSVFSKNRKRKS